MLSNTIAKLSSGEKTMRIVCFGDSITGVYYHTGGRRAYCDMLAIALKKIYPDAKMEMINAGISGNDSSEGLARLDRDVLSQKPDLVVIMFGMNDIATKNITPELFSANLKQIARRCREIGAEVVLCTQNSIYPAGPRRPVEKLAAYTETVRATAKDISAPLADCYRAFESVRAADPLEWKFLMSDTIHPNMNGHKLFAEVIAETISGQRVRLNDVPPSAPTLAFTFDRLAAKQPLTVIAMPPYDRILPEVIRKIYPDAVINMTSWPVKGSALNTIEKWAKDNIRKMKPDLVAVAVPAGAQASDEEHYIRSYDWVLNWSLAYGQQTWDTFAVLPSVTDRQIQTNDLARAELARRVVLGKDIGFIERTAGDNSTPADILLRWFQDQQKAWAKPRP